MLIILFSFHQEFSQNETGSRSATLSRLRDLLRGGCCEGGRSHRVQTKVSMVPQPPARPQLTSPAPGPAATRGRESCPAGMARILKGPVRFRKTTPRPSPPTDVKISALADYHPSNVFGLAAASRLALTGCPFPLRSSQMDELGTEPGQAGREAAGSGRRRAGARTDSGREGSPRLATQVTSSPAALGTVQKRPDPRSRGSLTPRVPEPRGRVPQELRSSGSRLPPPFPRAPSWREIAARLLRNSNINSNSSPGSADKVTALQRLGLSLSAAGSAPLRAPLPPPGGGQSRGRAVGAGPPPAGGSPRSPPRARGLLSFPAQRLTPRLSLPPSQRPGGCSQPRQALPPER